MQALDARWRALFARLGVDPDAAAPAFADLVHAYSAQGRHYHTLDHIAALFALLDRHGAGVADRNAIELAIFFHDAVYAPTRSDNEAQSAALARGRLTALGLPCGACWQGSGPDPCHSARERAIGAAGRCGPGVARSISTCRSWPPTALHIAAYARAIRSEYAVYPDAVYRPGRRHVLGHFLARPRIYRTGRLHELWDAAARANLEWELAELG